MTIMALPDGQLIEVFDYKLSDRGLMAVGRLGDGREFITEEQYIFPPQDRGPFPENYRIMMLEKQAD